MWREMARWCKHVTRLGQVMGNQELMAESRMKLRLPWGTSPWFLQGPRRLTAKGVGAFKGDVNGEVPHQRMPHIMALRCDLGDPLLQTL